MYQIPFSKITTASRELEHLSQYYSAPSHRLPYKQLTVEYFKNKFHLNQFYLTKSCTQSLELALTVANLEPGSEVILPSYGFVSLANSVALRSLKCVFVDCEKDTMNISHEAIKQAISKNTRAVITINYSGTSCNYEEILPLCKKNNLILIEDNAHGIHAKYNDKYLGGFGDISTISFDFLKNITCNEGGGISVNNQQYLEKFRLAYEFGTNKMDYIQGKTDHYEWCWLGSNHALAEQLIVVLYAQLLESEEIISNYISKWNLYYSSLRSLSEQTGIELPFVPQNCKSNGHMFWIKTKDIDDRNSIMQFLKEKGIQTAFHYHALHSSVYGKKHGVFRGEDINTTRESKKLLRLPLYNSLTNEEVLYILEQIHAYYKITFNP